MSVTPDPLLALYDAAIAGADPAASTARAIQAIDIPRGRRLMLYAFGKAASSMATAAVTTLLQSLHQVAGGVMVTPDGERSPYPTIVAMRGDHPVPGANSQ